MRTWKMIVLASVLTWGVLGDLRAASPLPEPPADITCRLDHGSGTLHASGPGGTEIRIKGAAGSYSGAATIAFASGAATPRMKFHFAGLRTLESFTLSSGKHSFQGRLGWGAGRRVTFFDKTGQQVSSPALAALTMVIEATKAGNVEISVSATRDVELGKELRVKLGLPALRGKVGKRRRVQGIVAN
jgi:hypothetical protein